MSTPNKAENQNSNGPHDLGQISEVWQPIETAPKNGTHIFARDAKGIEKWTFIDLGDWVYEEWLKNDAGEECLCFIQWNPVEYKKQQHSVDQDLLNPLPWLVVTGAGTGRNLDEMDIWSDHATYTAALQNAIYSFGTIDLAEEGVIIVKRLNDGTLTTEF